MNAAVVDTNVTDAGVLTGWEVFQAVIDAARRHDLPIPNAITSTRVYVTDHRHVLAWAEAFGAVADVYDGSRNGEDRIQASVDLPGLGLGPYFDVLGSGLCASNGTEHDHAACVAAVGRR